MVVSSWKDEEDEGCMVLDLMREGPMDNESPLGRKKGPTRLLALRCSANGSCLVLGCPVVDFSGVFPLTVNHASRVVCLVLSGTPFSKFKLRHSYHPTCIIDER